MLTDSGYNEHGHESAGGAQVAWMHSPVSLYAGTEFWLMLPTGAQKIRLSDFNDGGMFTVDGGTTLWTAADLSWSPDAGAFVGYLHSSDGEDERIYRVDLP
jgi:hypothetical protein